MARTRPQSATFFSEQPSPILECYDICEIAQFAEYSNMWKIFDLDNTVIEPADEHEEMGGDQWFTAFIQYASRVPLDEPNHIALVLCIYHAVQHHIQLKLVQPEVVELIKSLQNAGNMLLALTARGPEIMEPTIKQLKTLGIDFTSHWGANTILLDVGVKENPPVLKNGIIFCGGHPKEKCLKAGLDLLQTHPTVLMIDDKVKYLESVRKMVNEYQGYFIGLHFRRLDEKVKNHDFTRAQRKLHALRDHLPETAKAAMRKLKV